MDTDPKSVAWIRQQFDAEQRICEAGGSPGLRQKGADYQQNRQSDSRRHDVWRIALSADERNHEYDVAGGRRRPRCVPRYPAAAALQPAGHRAWRLVCHASGLCTWLCRANLAAGGALLDHGRTQHEHRATGLPQDRPAASRRYGRSLGSPDGDSGGSCRRRQRQALRTCHDHMLHLRCTRRLTADATEPPQ